MNCLYFGFGCNYLCCDKCMQLYMKDSYCDLKWLLGDWICEGCGVVCDVGCWIWYVMLFDWCQFECLVCKCMWENVLVGELVLCGEYVCWYCFVIFELFE